MFPAPLSRFLLALLLALMFHPAPASAERPISGRPLAVCVLRDTGGMRPEALVRRPDRFDCTSDQHRLGPGSYWVLSGEIGAGPIPHAVRFASLWQGGVALHILYADGSIRSTATDARGVTPLIQLGATVEQPLPPAASRPVRLLWHVRDAANMRGILLGARLTERDQSIRANLGMAAIYAGFAGLCIALLIHNIALWGALRHRFQLRYCAMIACLLGYAFSSSGMLAWVFPEIANNDRLRINYLLLGLTGGAALIFARSFFERRVFAGWLGTYTHVVAAALAAGGIGFFLFAPWAVRVADAIFSLVFLGITSVVLPTLWRAWRLRSNYLWLFALAWGAPIITAVLRTLASLHVIGWSFWLDNSTILAMTVEALASALAIAYRIRLLRDERDEAVAAEVMARRLADTDPLTGLLNRRAFLDRALHRDGEQQLLIADLDHFKRVNETLGHQGGDEVLRLFARVLRTSVPAEALVARLGGEEFAILTHAGQPVEPEALLARLRATHMPFDLKITASIGSCGGVLQNDVDWKSLYRDADAALFAAKAAGRDRARHALREAA